MNANRSVMDAFSQRGGGPQSFQSDSPGGGKGSGGGGKGKGSSFQGSGGKGKGGKGGVSSGGKGGKGMWRDGTGGKGGSGTADRRSYESHDAVGKAMVFSGRGKGGQFDDADSDAISGDFDAMFDELIDATMNAPNGCLVFDYEATEEEKCAAITLIDQSAPRTIEELLGYTRLEAAIGE
jgi:hypothetical protein